MYDRIVQMTLLYDFYGQLLTPKQIEIMEMHYNDDLSLSEISEHLNISRQGVYDSLKRAENTLFEYEAKLGLVNRFLEQKENNDKVLYMIDRILAQDMSINEMRARIEEVKAFVKNFQ